MLLSLALTAYEDSLCGGCGQPKDRAYNPDMDGWYEARADIQCASCAAMDRHREETKKPEPGTKSYVIDARPAHDHPRPWVPPSAAPADPDAEADRAG